jgi:pyridinium-3,5-biscarboxylic acid mononucleotide sulfurtransferase
MSTSPHGARPTSAEAEVIEHLREGGPALVALSGGVDSSLVAAWAREALGDEALAVTLSGPAVGRSEIARARQVAAVLGIRHEIIPVDPLERPEYRANPENRCYYCRSVETSCLRAYGDPRGVRQYLDGVHVDDLDDDRPGLRAMEEAGFAHPLIWGGWTKAKIREAAKARQLPNWDQPADACLASRVAHGEPISRELLDRIESAEEVLHARGFRQVRVRTRRGAARIEVDPSEVPRLLAESLAAEVTGAIRGLGFDPVTIDPRGYGRARGGLVHLA